MSLENSIQQRQLLAILFCAHLNNSIPTCIILITWLNSLVCACTKPLVNKFEHKPMLLLVNHSRSCTYYRVECALINLSI